MAGKVLITARAFWDHGREAESLLTANGFAFVSAPRPGPLPEAELLALLPDFDAVIASSDAYTARVFAANPRLKIVSRWGVGVDSVDLNAATQAGVLIMNCPGSMTEPVADYAFALLFSVARRVVEGDALIRAGNWGELPGVLVWGKTLGLVGFGQIGQGVARRAAGFNMRVLAYDPPMQAVGKQHLSPDFADVEFVELDDLLAQSDFVSVHAPNMPETRQMFNAERFARMKPSAYFINTARGVLVDEAALLHALQTGQIAGAALDVFSQEPLPADTPLRNAPNCVLTPHNAFNAAETARATSAQTVQNILAVWRGDHTSAVRNPDVWNSPALRMPSGE